MNVLALRPIEQARARRHLAAVDYESCAARGDELRQRSVKGRVGAPVSQEKKP
ncbi:MAG: hypothetical protein ACREV4_09100 [Gammaproteobacteria bacterium]